MRLFKIAMQFLGLVWIGTGAWWLSINLSADAVGIVIGLLFGLLAGIPSTLILLRAARRAGPQLTQNQPEVYIVESPRKQLPGAQNGIQPLHNQ